MPKENSTLYKTAEFTLDIAMVLHCYLSHWTPMIGVWDHDIGHYTLLTSPNSSKCLYKPSTRWCDAKSFNSYISISLLILLELYNFEALRTEEGNSDRAADPYSCHCFLPDFESRHPMYLVRMLTIFVPGTDYFAWAEPWNFKKSLYIYYKSRQF